jgi:hypothetical protein
MAKEGKMALHRWGRVWQMADAEDRGFIAKRWNIQPTTPEVGPDGPTGGAWGSASRRGAAPFRVQATIRPVPGALLAMIRTMVAANDAAVMMNERTMICLR